MKSPAKRLEAELSSVSDGRRGGHSDRDEPDGRTAPLEVTDIVQHGTGRGSRMDLTIVFSGRRVRLTRLPTKEALSYARIEKAAMEQGEVLPYFRYANQVWRGILSAGMKHVRIEPQLEGEDIAVAMVEEIRALLERGDRGVDLADLRAGKVVEQVVKGEKRLLVSPEALAAAVRDRMVDDVLQRATIAEAAASEIGMIEVRPRFGKHRPCAWSFPLPLPAVSEHDEDERLLEAPAAMRDVPASIEVAVSAGSNGTPSGSVHGRLGESAISGAQKEIRVGSDGRQGFEMSLRPCGPVHGPLGDRPIFRASNEMRSGSNWTTRLTTAEAVHGRRAEQAADVVEDESQARSEAPYILEPAPDPKQAGEFDSSKISRKTATRPQRRTADLEE